MKLGLVAILSAIFLNTTSIYTLQYENIDGVQTPMTGYQGKKILLVNIATGSQRVGQLAQLQQLHQQHGDSVFVIAFPSNSFGKEHRSNQGIKQFCQTQYGVTFPLAAKNPIAGPQIQAVYNWLTSNSENGMMGDPVKGDFQKFLINETGMLIGVYAPSVSPMSPQIIQAITN